jgi:hypothetical protein
LPKCANRICDGFCVIEVFVTKRQTKDINERLKYWIEIISGREKQIMADKKQKEKKIHFPRYFIPCFFSRNLSNSLFSPDPPCFLLSPSLHLKFTLPPFPVVLFPSCPYNLLLSVFSFPFSPSPPFLPPLLSLFCLPFIPLLFILARTLHNI